MHRYFMHLAYRGAAYHGWQIQPADISVQQVLEQALSTLLRTPTAITGAGRTDAGVNARMMIAHFDTDLPLDPDTLVRLPRSLNAICRPDIVVYSINPVHHDAHARFDATSRTYRYMAHTYPDPFAYPLSWLMPPDTDIDAMNTAARHLLGTHDFTSFSKLHTDVKTNICTVTHARWHQSPDRPDNFYFEITADRFLRNMVRAVVGTLVLVGRHKISPDNVADIIRQKNRCSAGSSMPPHPLFLWNITYPYPVTTQPPAI